MRRAALALASAAVLSGLSGCGEKSPISTDAARSGEGRLVGGKDQLYVAECADFPDLSRAKSIRDWDERGAWVVRRLRATARSSQGEAIRLARKSRAVFRSEWIGNVLG